MPTIGKNIVNGGMAGTANNSQGIRGPAFFYTAVAGDIVDLFSIYAQGDGATPLYLAVYTVTAGAPDLRLAAAVPVIPGVGAAWYSSAAVSQNLVAGTVYTVAMNCDPAHAVSRFIAGIASDSRDASAALPAVWNQYGTRNYEYSFFANVTNAPPPPTTKIYYPCKAQLIT